MEVSEELRFEGSNFFRQYLTFSLLSGRPVCISQIRTLDDDPGIKAHEVKLISMFEKMSNGTEVNINKTGTQVRFTPGLLQGGEFELECNNVSRCLSYFLEPLLMLSPFCKSALNVTLKGVTNALNELSVDAIRATWLPVFNKFVLNDETLNIKINARGFLPDGGGSVLFTSPIVKTLKPVLREKPGKICKIRGLAYVCKVSPSLASRMIDSAKKMLRGYIADVYITLDQRKGPQGGLSPGFGIFLTAETTEGVFYHGEDISVPKGSEEDQTVPEDIGIKAAKKLLGEIYRGGCLDTSAQCIATTFMTLCEKDVSKFLFGPLSVYSIQTLRNLKKFFGQIFKIDELWKLQKNNDIKDDDTEERKEGHRIGSREKALMTCVGVGYFNINKNLL